MTHNRTASSPPARGHTHPTSLLEPLPEPAEPDPGEWYVPDRGPRVRLAPVPGLHRQDRLDSLRQSGGWWWILHVFLAAEVALILVILLGRLLTTWLGMP